MNYLPDAALFLGLVAALIVAGWCVSDSSHSTFESAFVPGAAFLGVYAWLIWIVGSLWSLIPAFWCVLPWPLLLVLIALKRRNLALHARRALAVIRTFRAPDTLLWAYLLGLFALTFVFSLAPPGAADYDSLMYHLAVPAHYLRAGRVIELPYDHHSYFPMSLEMLFALGLWARGVVLAKLFHWLMLPLGALALVALGKRAGTARGGLLAACLYASAPLILQEATTAYIDLGFAAWTFLAILCLTAALETRARRDFALCGAFCGFCLGTKYFGPLIFGFLGLWLLFSLRKSAQNPERENDSPNATPLDAVARDAASQNAASHNAASLDAASREAVLSDIPYSATTRRLPLGRAILAFTLPALILGGFWYARNIAWTGNPVFPFAYGLFGGRGWTAEMARLYDESQAIYGFGRTPTDAVWLPWRLSMAPLNFKQPFWPFTGAPPQSPLIGSFEVVGLFLSSFIGPALFALGLPALLLPNKPRPIQIAAVFFAFLLVFWFVTSQQIRYLIPALGLLALIGGWGWAQFAPRMRFSRLIGTAILGVWFAWAPYWLMQNNRSQLGVMLGAQTPNDYLNRAFSGYPAMSYINQNLPKTARIAVFGEPRCFYLDRDYFWADDPHNNLLNYAAMKTGADFARELRAQGATHVLWNTKFAQNGGTFGPPMPLIGQAIENGELILVNDVRGYQIYVLKPVA